MPMSIDREQRFASRMRIVMKLKDTLVSFLPAGMPTCQHEERVSPCARVAFLTERFDLKVTMKRVLQSDRFKLTQVSSIGLLDRTIEEKLCDAILVDIERQDVWPHSIFVKLDETAKNFPVIILCKNEHDIPDYLSRAENAIEIVSYKLMKDPRFPMLVEAAIFRAEIAKGNEISQDQSWNSSSAA